MKFSELTIKEYSLLLSARKSTPGGGSCLALVLELACDLGLMMSNFTLGKKGYEEVQDRVKDIVKELEIIKDRAHLLIDLDGAAYEMVMDAYKSREQNKIKEASLYACEIPYELYNLTKKTEELCLTIASIGNKNLVSDAKIAIDLCRSIYNGCLLNIECNINNVEETKREKFLSLLK